MIFLKNLVAEYLEEKYNTKKTTLFNYNIYCLCGDGDLMEGISYEAASFAGQNKLNKVAKMMAFEWVYLRIKPDTTAAQRMCLQFGFNYDSLLSEEVDYLKTKIEEEIMRYGGS